MIFERLPPGQAATRIMPKAMDGWGLRISVRRKVKAGRSMNWATRPIPGAFGEIMIRLKSSSLRSKATPNIMRPMAALTTNNIWGLKLSRTWSTIAASIPTSSNLLY